MKKRKLLLSLLVVLCVVAMVASLVACNKKDDNKDGPTVDINETNPLVLQSSELDGVFNPFFYSSAYDEQVITLVNNSLFIVDRGNAIVAGDQYATVAKKYTIGETAEDGSVTYTIVLKNGLKFSDGSAITAEDVLFNYYVYLDPKYDGSSTMYTLPIKGLTEYRTQTTPDIAAKYSEIADYIFSLGSELGETDFAEAKSTPTNNYPVSYALYSAYWSYEKAAGTNFAQEIVNYVLAENGSDAYVKSYFHPGLKYSDLDNVTKRVAFGMATWGFGSCPAPFSVSETGDWVKLENIYERYDANNPDHKGLTFYNLVDGKYVKTAYDNEGNPVIGEYVKTQSAGYVVYNAAEHKDMTRYTASYAFKTAVTDTELNLLTDELTVADYWNEIKQAYGNDYSEASGINYESAGTPIEDFIKELFISGEGAKEVEGGIPNIEGLSKGNTTIDGVQYETINITCTKASPKTLLQLGAIIAPKAYYTNGYTYGADATVNYGVELNSPAFMAHLKTKNNAPSGAGPYKFVDYKDNVVSFERNEQFASFGLGNAKIKYVRIKVISGGQEYDAVKAGEVHYATVSATSDVVSEVATIDSLSSILVDNLGYGYICINPTYYKNLNERIAIQSIFNLALVGEYYPNGLAEVIYRAMSKVSWAYPDDATAVYDYDESGEFAKTKFAAAGYTWDASGNMLDPSGARAEFVFTLPSGASDHPAGRIFVNAKRILEKMGAVARVEVDTNLISNIKVKNTDTDKAGVAIYALAWQAASDPDMYQVYHKDSQANSVGSNGIKYLDKKGNDNALGTITWKNQTLNQTQALAELADLIDEAASVMEVVDRAPIYKDALELLAKLAIEVPTYQRKNMFVYNSDVIDKNSLSADVTPYWGPMAEIWEVSFKK